MPDCKTGYTWTNTSQTLSATPANFCKAANKDDLLKIVKDAVSKGQKIRITGGRHSWYPLVMSDKTVDGGNLDQSKYCMIDVSQMTTITKEKTPEGLYLVHVEPGATMGDLEDATMGKKWPKHPAAEPLVALSTNGVIPTELQLGGFVGAGCHGTGWEQPTIPDLVHSLEFILVDADKNVTVKTFSEETDGDLMNVVRVNLGTIGIMSKITFKAEPLYCIHGVDTVDELLSDVISRTPSESNHPLKDLVESTDYLELFWFPFNASKTDIDLRLLVDVEKTKVWKKMGTALKNQGGVSPPDCPKSVPSQVWDNLETKFGALAYTEIAKWSSATGILAPAQHGLAEGTLKAMSSLAYLTAPDDFIAPATRFFHYQKSAFPVLDFSFAIPMDATSDPYYENISKAWYAVVDAVADWAENKSEFYQRYPVNVTLHARFIKNSQSLLSPAYHPKGSETHTCWIEFLSGSPTPAEPDAEWYKNYMNTWAEFCRYIGPIWLELGGVPHWAKEWQLLNTPEINIYDKIHKIYGENLTTFKAERDKLDPTETFLFTWTAKIFND